MPASCRQTSLQPLARRERRGQPQDVGDQPPDGLGDGGGVGAGLGGVDEDFEGLVAAVLVDGDEGLAQRGARRCRCSRQAARARFLALVPQVELLRAVTSDWGWGRTGNRLRWDAGAGGCLLARRWRWSPAPLSRASR